MIPEAKIPAVSRALSAAFGVREYEEIRLLSGGLSTALVYRIAVRGAAYLLKIMRAEVISNPANEFACMQLAAEAGLAPRVWYASVEDRLLITDFVEGQPFPQDKAEMAALIAPTIRRIHTLAGFPKVVDYLGAVDNFILRFQAAKLLPESETAEVFRRYAEVQRVYPRNAGELVASHNDLKPQNMIFDGDRILLIDWESAFLNDPYADLAIAANFFVRDAEGSTAAEESYLAAYFGEPPGAYRLARFFLMRQAVSMFYATLLLLEAARAGLPIDARQAIPDFWAYHDDLTAGRIDMLDAEAKRDYGLLHLRAALQNMRSPRFAEAVDRIARG